MIMRSRRRGAARLIVGLGLVGSLVVTVAPAVGAAEAGCAVSNGTSRYSDLQAAIDHAAARATLAITGTCRPLAGGSFHVSRSITLSGDAAVLEGVATPSDFGPVLNPVLTIAAGTTVTVSGLTITGGEVGITNAGTLTVEKAIVRANAAGGISNAGTLAVVASTVSDSGEGGPGIVNTGTASLTGSTVTGNHAMTEGGGIRNGGTLTLTDSTVTANSSAYHGGGIFNGGVLSLINTTVTANSAQGGGGIWNAFIAAVCIAPTMTVTDNEPNQVIGNYVVRSACP
jgi:hypothetical protein